MALPGFVKRGRRPVIGLDVGASAVRAALVAFSGNRPVVQKLGQVALPPGTVIDGQVVDPPILTAAVLELRKGLGVRGGDVVLGCEQMRGVVRVVDLPWIPAKLRQQSLPLLAADKLSMVAEDIVADFDEYGEATDEDGNPIMNGLLAVASTQALLTEVQAVEAAGLRVSRIDLSAFALVRSLAADLTRTEPEAIVDIGVHSALVVIHTGGRPQVVRMSPIATEADGGRLIADIQASLNLLTPDGGGTELTRLAVSGGSATAEVVERLSQLVRAPVEVESAFRNVELGALKLGSQQLRVMSATAAVCVGLALGEAA